MIRGAMLAAVAWPGAAAGWVAGPTAGLAATVLLGIAAVGCALRPGAARSVAAPLLVVAATGVVVAVIGVQARQAPPECIARAAEITARLEGPGNQLATAIGRPPQLAVPVRASQVRCGATQWRVDLPLRLVVAAAEVPDLPSRGSEWRWTGRLVPPERPGHTLTATADRPPVLVAGPSGSAAVVTGLTQGLASATAAAPADPAALVAGIALGDESRVTPLLADQLTAAGLSHLTAVSGGNFVVVIGAVVLLARIGRLRLPGQVVAGVAALLTYAVVVGPQPSVLRAGLMAGLGLLGLLLGGPARGPDLLATAVTLLLLLSPELAWSLGFLLSAVATAALLLGAPRLLPRLRRLPSALAAAVAVTLAATGSTAPFLLLAGAGVSWTAIPANVLVVPFVAPVTLLGVAAAVVAAVGAGPVLGLPAAALALPIVLVARAAAAVAAGAWVPPWERAGPLLLVAGSAWWYCRRVRPARAVRVLLAAAVLVLLVAAVRTPALRPDWRVLACDVGQGTAVLVNTTAGPVLVDTGPPGADLAACLRRGAPADVALVAVSHPHADHVGGLPDLLHTRSVGRLVVPTGAPQTSTELGTTDAARTAGIPVEAWDATVTATWGDVAVTVLWPPRGTRTAAADANNGSLVLLLTWPDGFRALLPGDIEPESQRRVMARWPSPAGPSGDALQVALMPHHGSDHADPRFAAWASPAVAIASAGAGNSYGHPAPGTLAEYQAAGSVVRRTDTDGCVAVGGVPGGAWTAPC